MVDAVDPPSFWERTFSPEIRNAYNLDRTARRDAERAASDAEKGLGETSTRISRDAERELVDLDREMDEARASGNRQDQVRIAKKMEEIEKRKDKDLLDAGRSSSQARLSADRVGTPNLENVRAQRAARRVARAAKLRTFFRGGVAGAAGIGLGFAVNAYRNAQKRAAAGDPEAQAQSDQLMRFLNGEDMAPEDISALASSMPDNFSDLTELRDRALQDGVRAGDAIREATPPEDIEAELGEDVQALEGGIDPRDLDDGGSELSPTGQMRLNELRGIDPQAQGAGLDVGAGPERIFNASFTPGSDGGLGSAPVPEATITDVDLSAYQNPTQLQDVPSEFDPEAFQFLGALEGPGVANEYRTAAGLQDGRNQSGAEFDAGLATLVDGTPLARPVLNARVGADQGADPNAGFWESMFPRADQVASGVYGAARGAYNFADETGALDLVRPLWREFLREGGATPLVPDAGAQPLPADAQLAAQRARADEMGLAADRPFSPGMNQLPAGLEGTSFSGPGGLGDLPPIQGPVQSAREPVPASASTPEQDEVSRAIDEIVRGDEVVYPRGQDIRERDQGGDGGLPQMDFDGLGEVEASAGPRLGFGAAQAATLGGDDFDGNDYTAREDFIRDNPLIIPGAAMAARTFGPGIARRGAQVARFAGRALTANPYVGAGLAIVGPTVAGASDIPEGSPYWTPSAGLPTQTGTDTAQPAPEQSSTAPQSAPAGEPLTFSEADLSDNARAAEAEINPVRSGGRSGPLPTASEAPDPDEMDGEAPELNAINRYMRDTLGLDDEQRARAAELLLDFGGRLANTPGNFAQGFSSAAAGTGATARDLSRSDAEMGLAEQELQMRQDAARRDAALDGLRQRKLEQDLSGASRDQLQMYYDGLAKLEAIGEDPDDPEVQDRARAYAGIRRAPAPLDFLSQLMLGGGNE